MGKTINPLILTGSGLTAAVVADVARRNRKIEIDPGALARMANARAIVDRHLEDGRPVYGLNTGLGPNVIHEMPAEAVRAPHG